MLYPARKLATAVRVFQTHGVKGMLFEYSKKVDERRKKSSQKLNQLKMRASIWGQRQLNKVKGKLVEAQGSMVTFEECKFNIDSPAISLDAKSYFLFGRYEKPEREALKQFLDPNLPVVEFGAAIGVIACLTNKKLRNPRRHVVVEANPAVLPLLEENRERNNCCFTILHRAVAYGDEATVFFQNENYLGSSVQATYGKPISVSTISLQDVIREFDFEQCSLICDIEGGEGDLVHHEADILRKRVKTLMVEVHDWILGLEGTKNMFAQLERIGFVLVFQDADTYVFQNKFIDHLDFEENNNS